MSDFLKELIEGIIKHHQDNPDHGISCACMDEFIQKFRNATETYSDIKHLQRRVDYVIWSAIDNRRGGY